MDHGIEHHGSPPPHLKALSLVTRILDKNEIFRKVRRFAMQDSHHCARKDVRKRKPVSLFQSMENLMTKG